MKLWRVDDVMTKDVVSVREDTLYRAGLLHRLTGCGGTVMRTNGTAPEVVPRLGWGQEALNSARHAARRAAPHVA